MDEVTKIHEMENSIQSDRQKKLSAYSSIPYSLISSEIEHEASNYLEELTEIAGYYNVYKHGAKFTVEGTNNDYTPATLKYKMTASLINKEARFLFGESPDINVNPKGSKYEQSDETLGNVEALDLLVKEVLNKNNFEDKLVKAAKDCFIGKRVAGLINFNEEDGVTITFLPSTQFLYETKIGNETKLNKFVCFIQLNNQKANRDKRIFKKKYTLEQDEDGTSTVYLEETIHDGAGALIDVVTEKQGILLEFIPAVIISNDGLTGESEGESEVAIVQDFESWYSKLSNADTDANRKSMNPIRYTIDMERKSTQNLSSSAGSFWDLGTDQNLTFRNPGVGVLESSMSYSDALKTSLDRIKTVAYEQLDMPNITMESMQGMITSGKSLKAIYWSLIVRCKEKMKTWEPALRQLIEMIIEGAFIYPETISKYSDNPLSPVDYEVQVINNTPLPEDEAEEKQTDLLEVSAKTMSRKAYMIKWRNLTDAEVDRELEQIALEREITEESGHAGLF